MKRIISNTLTFCLGVLGISIGSKLQAHVLSQSSVEPTQNILGFVIPTGGGSESNPTPTRLSIYRAGLDKLAENLAKGATVGNKFCVLEPYPFFSSEDYNTTKQAFARFEAMLPLLNLPRERFATYIVNEPSTIRNEALAQEIATQCGFVHIPGGNQTVLKEQWLKQPIYYALLEILKKGGGISGSSAGATILGSFTYFPPTSATSAETEESWVQQPRWYSSDFTRNFLTQAFPQFPLIYIETHTEQRERLARALSIMAHWERNRPSSVPARSLMAIALNVDTGVLISYDASLQAWTGRVVGGRAAEFVTLRPQSEIGVNSRGFAYVAYARTDMLFPGETFVLSGSSRGKILGEPAYFRSTQRRTLEDCSYNLASYLDGHVGSDSAYGSQVWFRVLLRDTAGRKKYGNSYYIDMSEHIQTSDVDTMQLDSYLTGDFVPFAAEGCGLWVTQSFQRTTGQRRNRLAVQRYALGAGLTPFSVSLPWGMRAELLSRSLGEVEFVRGRGPEAVVQIYDMRTANNLGTSTYIYPNIDASGVVQIGAWHNGTVHLLPPNSRYVVSSGKVYLRK